MAQDKSWMFLHYFKLLAPDAIEPIPEFTFAPPRKWRFDWAFLSQKIAIEVEGNAMWVKGGGRHMADKDLEKYNKAALMGWRVFRFSPGMLSRDPSSCIQIIVEALSQ